MKRLAILSLAALSLASCTTTGTSSIDTAVQRNLPKVCDALQTAHIAFLAVAATGKIKAKTVAKEAAAYAGVQTICIDPKNTTAINAAILVGQAYVVVSAALKEARQ